MLAGSSELRAAVDVREHDPMSRLPVDRIRAATAADADQLLRLWALLFDENTTDSLTRWKEYAREWFASCVENPTVARFPVVEVAGDLVATAIGTLEVGVPNPQCPRGRSVRLANVITVSEHRAQGHGTLLVRDVIEWARSIHADRVDLSATPDGQHIYVRAGFDLTSAPRMKLVL